MIYVTSDIHGYPLEDFLRLLEKARFGDDDFLYILGDVIDRNGDGGVAMLQWIIAQPNVQLLMGNHEAMMLSCMPLFEEVTEENFEKVSSENLRSYMEWLLNGADPTVKAMKKLRDQNPQAYRDVLDELRDLKLYETVSVCGRDFLLVHSGLGGFSPERKLSDYSADELLWTRPSPDEHYFPNVMTILGHTPTGYMFGEKGKMFQTKTWIDIDTGAAGGGAPMLLRLEDLKAFYAEADE